jgi:hypothetical protein
MKTYKMRFQFMAKAAVWLRAAVNANKNFYTDLVFNLDQFIGNIFADLIFVFNDQSVSTSGAWPPPNIYQEPNICFALGYNYRALTMDMTTTFKYPNCYKMVIKSFTDWSQWTSIITNWGNNAYLFGLLDACSLSDDNVQIQFWSYNPVASSNGDNVFFGNDIFLAPSSGSPVGLTSNTLGL